jgi:hypothetical protein
VIPVCLLEADEIFRVNVDPCAKAETRTEANSNTPDRCPGARVKLHAMRVRDALGSAAIFQDNGEWEAPPHGGTPAGEQLPGSRRVARVKGLPVATEHKNVGHGFWITPAPLARVRFASSRSRRLVVPATSDPCPRPV